MATSRTVCLSPGQPASTIIFLLILLIAMVPRIIFMLGVSNEEFLSIDGADYRNLSDNLAAGRGYVISHYRWFEPEPANSPAYHPELFRPPLLPWCGAALKLLGVDWLSAARVTAILLGCALVFAVGFLGKTLFGYRAGALSALAFAIYPYAVHYSCRWSTETLFSLLLVTGAALLARGAKSEDARYLALGTLSLALASLARPIGLAFAIILPTIVLMRLTPRNRARPILACVLVLFLVLIPWTVRNYRLTNQVSPSTYFGPYNIWLGMNQGMDEMYRAGSTPRFAERLDQLYQKDLKHHINELETKRIYSVTDQQSYWLKETVKHVNDNPRSAIYILSKRLAHFFRPWPNRSVVSPLAWWVSAITVSMLFALSLISLVRYPKFRSHHLLVPMGLAILVSLPFVFHLRFRFPSFEPFVVVIAAAGIVEATRGRFRCVEKLPR